MNSFKFHSLLIVFGLIFLTKVSMAETADKLIFGPEWTFTNSNLLAMHDYESGMKFLMEDIQQHFQKKCLVIKNCTFEKTQDSFKIGKLKFNSGFEVNMMKDPGVIELSSTPLTYDQWMQSKNEIQKNIFDAFSEIKLAPDQLIGAGHLNIGLEYFKNNPLLLRNFIVDFYNNPGVGIVLNSLSENQENAPSLEQMDKEERDQFIQQLKVIDSSKEMNFLKTIKLFSIVLAKKYVGLGIRDIGLKKTYWSNPSDFTNIHINEKSRFEVRTLRPQANMDDYMKVIEIFQARIQLLEKIKQPIPLLPIVPMKDPRVALGQYADYLKESGLRYDRYKSLMPAEWRELKPSQFIRSTGVKSLVKKEATLQCSKMF